MKILLINLDRSPERLKRMETLLADSGLTFERVPAVDGKLLSETELRYRVRDDGKNRRMAAGEIACFLSHRKCWEAIAAGAESHAVIFEDDIHLGRNATDILSRTDWIPADADIVKIETALNHAHIDKTPTSAVCGRNIVRLWKNSFGSGGYIVSRQAASELLSLSETFSCPIDNFLFIPRPQEPRSLTIYQMVPALCIQEQVLNPDNLDSPMKSTLETERHQTRRKTGIKKISRNISKPLEKIFRTIFFALKPTKKISIGFE